MFYFTLQYNTGDAKPTQKEIKNVADELKKIKDGINKLALEIEVEIIAEKANPEYATILDWVMHQEGTRYNLAVHLREAGFIHLSNMYIHNFYYTVKVKLT